MIKLAVLFTISIAFIATFSLKLGPEDLKKIWTDIDQRVTDHRYGSETEVNSTSLFINPLHIDALKRIQHEIHEAAKDYKEKISQLQTEAQQQNISIASCVELGNTEIDILHRTTFNNYTRPMDQLINSTAEAVSVSMEIIREAGREQQELGAQVDLCQNIECANALEVLVVEFYNRVILNLAQAVVTTNTAVLIKYPLGLSEISVDEKQYQNDTEIVYQDVLKCANLTLIM